MGLFISQFAKFVNKKTPIWAFFVSDIFRQIQAVYRCYDEDVGGKGKASFSASRETLLAMPDSLSFSSVSTSHA